MQDHKNAEALIWCCEHAATVQFGSESAPGMVSVEVLAPNSTWKKLRGEGKTFVDAAAEAKRQFDAELEQVILRNRARRPLPAQ